MTDTKKASKAEETAVTVEEKEVAVADGKIAIAGETIELGNGIKVTTN